jgi:hypothetical protein
MKSPHFRGLTTTMTIRGRQEMPQIVSPASGPKTRYQFLPPRKIANPPQITGVSSCHFFHLPRKYRPFGEVVDTIQHQKGSISDRSTTYHPQVVEVVDNHLISEGNGSNTTSYHWYFGLLVRHTFEGSRRLEWSCRGGLPLREMGGYPYKGYTHPIFPPQLPVVDVVRCRADSGSGRRRGANRGASGIFGAEMTEERNQTR